MGRKKKSVKEAEARATLVSTICKIQDLDPMLGGKWRDGMIKYYSERLAELLLVHAGHAEPPADTVANLAEYVRHVLSTEGPGGL